MQPKKIPTIVGLSLVFGAIIIFSLIFDRITPFVSRASVSSAPVNVRISNISDSTFSVSWFTPEATTGVIAVEEKGGKKYTAFDDRDQQPTSATSKTKMNAYISHIVTVRNATSNSLYQVRIVSNGKLFQNGTHPYEIMTGPALSGTGTSLEPAFGSAILQTGLPAEGSLIHLTPENGQTLTTLVTASGTWVIPLHLTRTENLQTYIPSLERVNETIVIQAPSGSATAQTDTLNDNPVPAMTIGKTYDFRKLQADTSSIKKSIAISTPVVLGDSIKAPSGTIMFVQPAQNAALSTNLPLISGSGVPGHTVQLIIGITKPITGSAAVGSDGLWRYTPKNPLSAGTQSVTMTTTDIQNKSVAITHMFEILKSGTQVLGDATPSATLMPTPTIDLTPTPTSTLAGEPIPTTGFPLPLILMLTVGCICVIGGIFTIII